MVRIGIFVFVLLVSSAAPAQERNFETFDSDVSWTIHSSYQLWSGLGGTANLTGHGPGRLTTELLMGSRMFDMLTFSDGKTGGMAGPLANGLTIFGDSNPRWTTGLRTEVESSFIPRSKNAVTFGITGQLDTVHVNFDRTADCIIPGGCSGVMSWMSSLVGDGTRMANVAAPEPTSMAVIVAGLVLSAVLRRRRP